MMKPSLFLVFPTLLTVAGASNAHALVPAPLRGAAPEVLACAMVTLAALALAYIGLRRSVAHDERARVLQHQLAAEREARCQADQALAANHDVLCRLLRRHERARAVTGGLRGASPDDGLRQALERCLAEHAQRHGLRHRFEAGVDPRSRASQDRAARLAVFRFLQDVLAGTGGGIGDDRQRELHVRLLEDAGTLGLEIDGWAGTRGDPPALPAELVEHIRSMGGVLRVAASAGRRARWSLSVPVRASPASTGTMAQAA